MTDRSAHCCLCGEPRRPTRAPVDGFGNTGAMDNVIVMAKHRPMQDGRWEQSPQMIASVLIYRNGGTAPGKTHICDGCIVVGLKHIKAFVDSSLEKLA